MKKLATCILIWCCGFLIPESCYLLAVPAKPAPLTITLKNGQQLTLRLHGDEFNHFYTTVDNYLIKQGEDGLFYYATEDSKISSVRVTDANIRPAKTIQFLGKINRQKQWDAQLSVSFGQSQNRASKMIRKNSSYPTKGKQKGLVILVEYQGLSFTIDNPHETFKQKLNKKGYNGQGAFGSANDYYYENSSGQFDPEFDVYGPILLSREMSYYGGNNIQGNDRAPEEMLIEACNQLDGEIDFSEYDRDKDGYIDNVYLFYAGFSEAAGGEANTVWPHSGDIEYLGKHYTYDGVKLNHYACSNELKAVGEPEGIGTFCHEFNHVLGLPDLYATSYTGAFTPGFWAIMDMGAYNNNGITPPYMNVYERYELGWLTPKEIGEPADLTLDKISTNKAYIIHTKQENEFFLLENRQQERWDTYIPGHGMLIWHIDYNQSVWDSNVVNNTPSHQYVDIEEADGILSEATRAGDAFPGTKNKSEFTDETSPSMQSWNREKQNKPITNINEKDGLITFLINDGERYVEPVKAILEATEITGVSFKAHWNPSSMADSYALNVYQKSVDEEGVTALTYVKGYKNYIVSDTFAIVINLVQETEYFYMVCAIDRKVKSEPSDEMSVRTGQLTFDCTAPVALEAGAITPTSFCANWKKLVQAQDYNLSVFTKQYTNTKKEVLDFMGGTLLPNWTTTSRAMYTMAGYYGKASPALRFSDDKQNLTSFPYEQDIRSVSFWYRGANSKGENTMTISGMIDEEWVKLDEISSISEAWGGSIYTLCDTTATVMPAGCKAIRIEFNKNGSGNVALDDLLLTFGGNEQINTLPQYEAIDMGDATSALVEGLQPGSFYYYYVTGNNGVKDSQKSNVVRVRTNGNGLDIESVEQQNDEIELRYDTSYKLIIINHKNVTLSGALYSLQGELLKTVAVSSGETSVNCQNLPGVYLLQVGEKCYKIVLH